MVNKYNTVVIDPPWPLSMANGNKRRKNSAKKLPYETMTLKEIESFPISDFCEKGCHVYLWTTNKFLRKSFEVFDKWGIKFHLILTAVKPSGLCPNMGYTFATEFCLLGFYGSPALKWKAISCLNWFEIFNTKGKHSRKPDVFYDKVERMSHAPYIDIFSRKNRKGWDSYGDEIGKFDHEK